jgi:hypothetical protein
MTVDAIVYNIEGNIISGVYAWPKGRPEDQTFVIGNGELIMSGLSPDDIIVFSFQNNIIEIPANQISTEIYLDFTEQLDEVHLTNKPKSNLGAWAFVTVFASMAIYAFSPDDTQKVSM